MDFFERTGECTATRLPQSVHLNQIRRHCYD